MYLPLSATYLFTCLCNIAFELSDSQSEKKISLVLLLSLAGMALSAGLSSRLQSSTSTSTVLGLQSLFSVGAGAGLGIIQRGSWIVPTIRFDFNAAIVLVSFGGSIGIAAAQTVFVARLSDKLQGTGSRLPLILSSGATNFKDKLSDEVLARVLQVMNEALTKTYFVATAAGALFFSLVALSLTIAIISRRTVTFSISHSA
jgi:hypothetical protein